MTAVIVIRVNDGVVLAADGRSVIVRDRDGLALHGYEHAGKVFPVCDLPALGVASSGAGSIGGLSIRFLCRRLRERFAATPPDGRSVTSTIEAIATDLRQASRDPTCPEHNPQPDLEWLIAGFAHGADLPEVHRLRLRSGRPLAPEPVRQRLVWSGTGTACLDRLIGGVAPEMRALITREVSSKPEADRLLQVLEQMRMELVHPEMPLEDAAALAVTLLELVVGVERLNGELALAAGRITAAVVDRFSGFRYLRGEPA